MKTTRYILLITFLVSSLCSSCVKDASLGNADFSQPATASQMSNVITLTSDMDKESLLHKITEKGFVIVRKLEQGEVKERVVLKPNDVFECKIETDLWPGLVLNVYPYIIDGGYTFYGQKTTIESKVQGLLPSISNVEIIPDDDTHLTGTIVVTGKYLKKYQNSGFSLHRVSLPGESKFELVSATNDRQEFHYECYNIGEFVLRYFSGSYSKILSETLDVKVAVVTHFDRNVILGIPHEVSVLLNGVEQKEVGAILDDKYKMSSSCEYDKSGKTKVIFSASEGEHMVYPYFMYKGHKVFLSSRQIIISSAWDEGIWLRGFEIGNKITSESVLWGIWDSGNRNQHSDEYISVSSYDLATAKIKYYTYNYSHYNKPWRTQNYMLTPEGDDVYFSVSLEQVHSSKDNDKCIRVLKITYGDTDIKTVGDIKYDVTNGKRNYELFAKVDDMFYFVEESSKTIMTWNSTTKAINYLTYDYDWGKYIGRDSNHFFFLVGKFPDFHLERLSISNLAMREKVELDISQRVNSVNMWNELSTFGNEECKVYNGRIYQSSLMRSTSTSDLKDHIYYGFPNTDYSSYAFFLMGNNVYCASEWSKLYKYQR